MFGITSKAIGVSIEQTGIRYISFKSNHTKQIHKKKYTPLLPGMIVANQVEDHEALLAHLKLWVKKEGLRGSKVNLSIPPSQIIIRKMSIPSTNAKQIEQLVRLEVETGLHLPFENPVYDFTIISQDEDTSELILFAAPRKVVQDYVDVLEQAGLRIRSVEVSATALARSIVAGYTHEFSETMLIHLEQSMLDIYMFRSGNPVFMRTIDLIDLEHGMGAILGTSASLNDAEGNSTVQEHLTPEQIVEIAAEISRMLSFYQYSLHDGSTRITEILLTGSPEMRNQLQQELELAMPEQTFTSIIINQFAQGTKQDDSLNDYRVAAGAALRSPKSFEINLLPREDRKEVLFPYLVLSLAAIWVLAVAGTGCLYVSVHHEQNNQTGIIQQLQDHNAQLQLELAGLRKNNPDAGNMNRTAIIEAISKDRTDAAEVLNELQVGLPDSGVIRAISYVHHDTISLTINFTDMKDSSMYLTSLRKMSFSAMVTIGRLTEGPSSTSGIGADAGAISNLVKYSAEYQIKLLPLAQQQTSEGGADNLGTNQ